MKRFKTFFRLSIENQKKLKRFGQIGFRYALPLRSDMNLPELALMLNIVEYYNLGWDTFLISKNTEAFVANNFAGYTLVQLPLVGEQVKKFEEWLTMTEFVPFDVWDELLSRGYSLKGSWLDDSNSYCFSVTGTKRAQRNRQKTILCWSDDLQETWMMALYKCLVLCKDGEWEDYASKTGSWG